MNSKTTRAKCRLPPAHLRDHYRQRLSLTLRSRHDPHDHLKISHEKIK